MTPIMVEPSARGKVKGLSCMLCVSSSVSRLAAVRCQGREAISRWSCVPRRSGPPANTQPAAHMSTAGLYSVLPNSSSGARYHRANTCMCTRPGLAAPARRQQPVPCRLVHSPEQCYTRVETHSRGICSGSSADQWPSKVAPTWLVYLRSGLPKMRDKPKSASFRLPAQLVHRSFSVWQPQLAFSYLLSKQLTHHGSFSAGHADMLL